MSSAPSRRNAQLAQIHIAKQQLQLDDATYQQMLFTVARVMTAAELDEHGRARVIEHLRARGFKAAPRKGGYPGRPHNIDSNPQLKKIEALLADGKKPWAYADGMARRMFKKDRIAFCDADQLQRLIAALHYQQQRHRASP